MIYDVGKLDKGKKNDVTNVRLRNEEHGDFCKKLVTFFVSTINTRVFNGEHVYLGWKVKRIMWNFDAEISWKPTTCKNKYNTCS